MPSPDLIAAYGGEALEQVRALFLEYAASLPVPLDFQDFEHELAGLPGDYAPPGGRLLLACWDGAPAACAALRPFEAATGELKRMYVRPAFRGRGIGRTMALRLLDDARTIGYGRVLLDTLPTMGEAQALYRSLGFRPVAPYRFNPVEGAVFLSLDLRRDAER